MLSIIRTCHSDLVEKMYYSVLSLPWNQFWILFDSCVSVCPLSSHFLLYPSPKLNRLSWFYSGYSWPWSAFWGKFTFSGCWKCDESREPHIWPLWRCSWACNIVHIQPSFRSGNSSHSSLQFTCPPYLSRCLTQWVLSEDQLHWKATCWGYWKVCGVLEGAGWARILSHLELDTFQILFCHFSVFIPCVALSKVMMSCVSYCKS